MGRPPVCCWIVDDDVSFGRSIQQMLSASGIPAEYFGSAQSFFDSVPSSQSGCAIVDIRMPGCDGFGLMQKMRDLHYDMPVIIITGQADGGERDRARKNGAVGFLQKPFSRESLLELIYLPEMERSTP